MITEKHNASLGDRLVDIIKMRPMMSKLTPYFLKTNNPSLVWQIEPNHKYWEAIDGQSIGPSDLLSIKNWEIAENNFLNWKEHILKVKNADLTFPIWICDMPDMIDPNKRIEIIFDGMHRYTKAVLEKEEKISALKVKYEDIPEEYFIK